jgi:hypothetical protein
MVEYLQHWWAGEVALHYAFLGLTIPQLNKLAKIGQYLSGTLALFDLIAFSRVMEHLRVASLAAAVSYRVWRILFNFPSYITGLLATFSLVVMHRHRWRRLPWIFASRAKRRLLATVAAGARRSPAVAAFQWLRDHPVPDRAIKATNFCLFLVFSATELLTS